MTTGMAAVQARIAQIQGQFGAPVMMRATTPPPAAPAFATVLAEQTALGGPAPGMSARDTGPTARPTGSTAATATTAPAGPVPAGGLELGEKVVALARQHLGTPYVWGGNAPGGFDCSGLVQWSYNQVGIDLPRVSTDQARTGRPVSAADARPGDLVFFERGRVDHIGLYAGDGQWLVAPKTGDVVKLQAVDLSKATTIRRVVPESAAGTGPGTGPGTAVAGSTASSAATAVSAPGTSAASDGSAFASLFAGSGATHGVSPALLKAVARAESGFDPRAQSPSGARGLMQLMPATAAGLGVDALDPKQAVDGAARLLSSHLSRFGSTELALAAYNAGPGAVTKHGGMPPYRETQDYVARVMRDVRGGQG